MNRKSAGLRLAGGENPGWLPITGFVLLAAWVPLLRYASLSGVGVVPFLCSFLVAGMAFLWSLKRLKDENPALWIIWGLAIAFRLVLLFTPVSLSSDVYRYIWDGHLLGHGINPYAQPVISPLLDGFTTALRGQVNFPWMASPYLPAAQVYFWVVGFLAPQSPFAFQLGAALLDLATGGMVLLILRRLCIPDKIVLIYLWNPLIIVEFAHGAHVDALMLFFMAAALWGVLHAGQKERTLSALALAVSVLVKGWPILIAPLFFRRWGAKRVILFGASVLLPLILFAAAAGWGISGPPDGKGVFGALRIYAATWNFNGGLFTWIEKLVGSSAARLIAILAPMLAGLALGLLDWQAEAGLPNRTDPLVTNRRLVRFSAFPFGLYLILAPTIHPWYLTSVLALLPFFWPAKGEDETTQRWIWPWFYFMFFEAFTYLAYSGFRAPASLGLIQTVGYIPFWLLLGWAALPKPSFLLDLFRVS